MTDVEHEDTKTGHFGMLFSRQYWRTTLFASGFWFCAVTPYFAIATFADSELRKYGLSGGLAGGVGLSAVSVVGVTITVLLIDRLGRRALTVPPQWICAALLALIGLWAGAPPIAVLSLFLAFSFFTAVYGTLTSVYPGEVFPTEIRGTGTGFSSAISRLGAALGAFLLPWSMTNLGTTVTMLIAAGVAAVGAALSQWLAPETNGRRLTEASAGTTERRNTIPGKAAKRPSRAPKPRADPPEEFSEIPDSPGKERNNGGTGLARGTRGPGGHGPVGPGTR